MSSKWLFQMRIAGIVTVIATASLGISVPAALAGTLSAHAAVPTAVGVMPPQTQHRPVPARQAAGAEPALSTALPSNPLSTLTGFGLAGWGANWAGELGKGEPDVPVERPEPAGSGALEGRSLSLASSNSGGYTNCAVFAGELYCWGSNSFGELGNGSLDSESVTPVKVDMSGAMAGTTVTQVESIFGSTCAVASGRAFCWGAWWITGLDAPSRVPVAIDTTGVLAGKTVTDIAVLDTGACVIADGAPYCWGGGRYGQLGNGQTPHFEQYPVAVDVSGALAGKLITKLTAAMASVCALASGRAYCWGQNYDGELGNGTTTDSAVPVPVGGVLADKTVTALSGGHALCAIAEAKAYCWGEGLNALLGTGTVYDYYAGPRNELLPAPVDTSGVLAGKAVTAIATADSHGCALADGKPYCWGYNDAGQLGTAIAEGDVVWSPVAIEISGTVLDGKALTGLSAGGGSTLVSYIPPPIGYITLEMTVASQITLTSTGHFHSDATGLNTYIYETSTSGSPELVASCPATATTCSWTGAPSNHLSSYIAIAAPPYIGAGMAPLGQATSNIVTPPAWTLNLTSSNNGLTATSNYDVGNSGSSIQIYDQSQQDSPIVVACVAGSYCSTPGEVGHTYIAAVGAPSYTFAPSPLIVSSNSVGTAGPTGAYETAGGGNAAELGQCYACKADPVNTSNGEYFENHTDLSAPGRGPGLIMARTYSSQRAPFDGPLGYGWSFTYNMSLDIDPLGTVDVHQENGSQLTFTADAGGVYRPAAHALAALVQNPDGTWTYTRRVKEIFVFTAEGRLSQVKDLNGNTTTLTRNAAGQVTTATDGSGRTLTFTYNEGGRIGSVTDPAGRWFGYGYDRAGRLVSTTAPDYKTTRYGYDSLNLVTSITDPRGNTTTNTYDQSRRVSSQTDRAGGTMTFTYAADGTTTTVSPEGRAIAETYSSGQLVKSVRGQGTAQAATWTYAYDQVTFGMTRITDPMNNSVTATYDNSGNRLTATDENGNQEAWTYNALNDVTTHTDPAGTISTYTWDAAGNLVSVSTPLTGSSQAATTTYGYTDPNHSGDRTTITDPNGNTSTQTYTSNGDLASTTDPLGNSASFTYDASGRRLTSLTPSGKKTTYQYDPAGRLKTVIDPLLKQTKFVYDGNGNQTGTTDALARTTITGFDNMNRPTSVAMPDGRSTTTEYDLDGNRTAQTDAAGHVTAYTYDSLNRLTSMTDPLNRSITYAYDGADHLTAVTDASGRVATSTFDPAGRKTGTSYSDGTTPSEIFTYTQLDLPATTIDGSGTTTSSYDSLGRLTTQTNGNAQTTTYTYDLLGHLTGLGYPNGQTVNRTYDAAGRLVTITDWLGKTTSFTPDADGNTVTTTYGNGIAVTKIFDATGQTSAVTAKAGTTTRASFTYLRNAVGNLTKTTTTGITQPVETYKYSPRDQITGVNTGIYGYDQAGNITSLIGGATLAYDNANQPTSYIQSGVTTPITHDQQGNRLSGPGRGTTTAAYTWNQGNELAAANGTAYTYNAAGIRTARTLSGGATQTYAWDTRANVPLMLTDGTTSYIYDDAGNPVEQIDSGGTALYYQHDQYGSTRLLTDSTGTTTSTFVYDAYGNLTAKTGTADTPLRWNGQYQDTDTGLYYLRARYYDPKTSQFISVDLGCCGDFGQWYPMK